MRTAKTLCIVVVCLLLQCLVGCALMPDSIGVGYNQGRYAGEKVDYQGLNVSFQWKLK